MVLGDYFTGIKTFNIKLCLKRRPCVEEETRVTFVSVRSIASKATSDIMSYILHKNTILRADKGGNKMSRNVGAFPTGVITQTRATLNLRFFFDSFANSFKE